MRMRTKWFKNHGNRSLEETGSALGFIIWQIAIDRLKSLRGANIDVFSPIQSINFLGELAIFFIHNADRIIHKNYSGEDRATLIQQIAVNVANNYAGNAIDALGKPDVGDHKTHFIELLNERLAAYSTIAGEGEGLRFSLSRSLGGYTENIASEKDVPWVAQQLIEIEIPEAYEKFDTASDSLLVPVKA